MRAGPAISFVNYYNIISEREQLLIFGCSIDVILARIHRKPYVILENKIVLSQISNIVQL